MKALCKTLVLLLATTVLASCGGGGSGGSNSAFNHVSLDVSVSASPATITTESFTTLVVTVKNTDGSPVADGEGVNVTLSPLNIGTLSGPGASGTTATGATSGGTASFIFNSSNLAGTAHIIASASVISSGNVTGTFTFTGATDVTVNAGNVQDPRLQLVASTLTLPVNPFIGLAEVGPNFETNFLGSPYIAEVGVTWRHSNGQLVGGTLTVNDSITPTTVAVLSELDNPLTAQSDPNKPDGNEFLVLVGSEPVNVTGGVGTIYVHSTDVPGLATLSVTAVDPDSGQPINSQLTFRVAGPSTGVPSSIVASGGSGAYISGSNGPQSTVLSATVFDGSDSLVADPGSVDNVQFQIVGPANSDSRLVAVNAAGQQNTGTTVVAATHNGIATATFQTGTQQGPVQIKMTADRSDNNVDNGISDPVSATTTVVVSDGKLYRLTISAPDASEVLASGTSDAATSSDGGATYDLPVTVSGEDRQLNPALPGTVIAFGGVDTPQTPSATLPPQSWFLISGTTGDPQEGGTQFNATNGHFTTAGGGTGPGDTLLVFGKQVTSPNNNDDLESARTVQSVTGPTSLNVATPFNRNDTVTGALVNSGPVLPYVIGRAHLGSIESPAVTDPSGDTDTGRAVTLLHYPSSAIGKAVAIWAQGNGTDTVTDGSDTVGDIITLVYPGSGPGSLTASPDPLLGDASVPVTVCYSDSQNQPISNFRLTFLFTLPAGASGSVDGISTSGGLDKVTGSNGCVTVQVLTSGLPTTTGGSGGATLTFTAGAAIDSNGDTAPSVTLDFIVNVNAMQISPCSITAPVSGNVTSTVTVTVLGSSGSGISGQPVSVACTSNAGSIVPNPTSGTTGSNGNVPFVITVTGVVPPTDTGSCLFTGPDNLQAELVINGTCANNGFSPAP